MLPTDLWHVQQMTPVQWGVVISASLAGAVCDIRSRRIPNWLSAAILLAGLVWAALMAGLPGLLDGSLAMLMLAAPFVLLFLFAGGGAGDAKLMGALGTWLGMINGLVVLTSVAVAGVAMAVVVALGQRRLRPVLGNIVLTAAGLVTRITGGRVGRELAVYRPQETAEAEKMPYGPAIFIGVCLAALGVAIWRT